MNKLLITPIVVLLSLLECPDLSAQATNQITHKWFNWRMDGEKIKWKQVKAEINKVPDAAVYLKKSLTNLTASHLTALSAFGFSYFGRQRVGNRTMKAKESNTGFQITSLALMGAAVYFITRHSKNLKQAISIHNSRRVVSY